MEKGRVFHSTLFLLRTCTVTTTEKDQLTRVAAVVPNKVGKKAVERTSMRRKMYEAVRTLTPDLVTDRGVIVFAKTPALVATTDVLNKEMKDIFVKAGLMR